MSQALNITGEMSIQYEGVVIHISGRGDTIVLMLPSLKAARRIWKVVSATASPSKWVDRVNRCLAFADVRIDIEIGGQPLARLGAGTSPSWWARWFGLPPLQIRPIALMRTWLASPG